MLFAAMAELADALDLGSSGVTRTGSIPASRTKSYISSMVIFMNLNNYL